MFYKQIILNNGLPFKAQLPSSKPLNISEMTEKQFNEEMEKAYQSVQLGKGVPVEEAFAKIKRAKQLTYKVIVAPEAIEDMQRHYDYIAYEKQSIINAESQLSRIKEEIIE